MKVFFIALVLFASSAMADCNGPMERFFKTIAPNTGKILIQGQYTKKAPRADQYMNCEFVIEKHEAFLDPDFEHEKFNPGYGDGGAFWPFGLYPTIRPDNAISFDCVADSQDGFSTDYYYRQDSGWRQTRRYILKLQRNNVGSYDASLRDGDPMGRNVTCRGQISEAP